MLHIINQYLRDSAERYTNHSALVDQNCVLTYSEVLDEAEHIAFELVNRHLFKKPIAVMMDKKARNIVAFLGVALSGNYYTVIDTNMPQDRIEKILNTFEPEFILVDKENVNKAAVFDRNILVYEDLQNKILNKDERNMISDVERKIIDTDILYVLFTSGSTGIPKGVIISHRSVIDYTEWVADTFHFNHDTVIGNQAPFYFDNSVLDIYSALRNGATLHVIPPKLYSLPINLLEYIRDNKINTIFWVPTILSRIADMDLLDKCDIDCLKNVLFAGEVMPAKQLNEWIKRLPNAVFANLYGPTEITVDCTYYIVNREIKNDESVPIGQACMNSDIIVLNKNNELVKVNEKGELCVRGSSLALGYYKNPEKTAEAFVQNPLNNLYHELIYRTGDIVHYNELGEIIYDGRIDSQIKHMGYRIELGEIETAVSAMNQIDRVCCIYDTEKSEIVLFYTGCIDSKEIKKEIRQKVPKYMIPNRYIALEDMPLNLNGKIDRLELRKLL